MASGRWTRERMNVRSLSIKAIPVVASKTASHEVEWLSDNGSCYIASNIRSFARALGLKPITTPVQSPESNDMVESFVKTFKRDYRPTV